MDTGTKISAIAHVSLIGWALFGGTFRSEPLPTQVQDVSVISAEQFAALTAQRDAPELPESPGTLEQPDAPEPEVSTPEVTPEEQPRPEPVTPAEPEPETVPETVEVPPEPELPEEPPTLTEPETAALPVPPGPEAQPSPAERVAPEAIAPPPPEAEPDEVETPPVSLDEGAETQQEQKDQTAPEEAAPEIVTEAEETDEPAPLTSPRPRVRPNRPEPAPEVAETPEPAPETPSPAPVPDNSDAINDALSEALAGGTEPSGPPLTSGEKDAMRVAVSRCWNVGSLSTDALNVVVTVAFSLNRDGTIVSESIRLLNSSGGASGAENQAYQAARRAILRCGARGYDLPADKYDHWQDIEITFNPERMRIK